jgi:hypothetical protein
VEGRVTAKQPACVATSLLRDRQQLRSALVVLPVSGQSSGHRFHPLRHSQKFPHRCGVQAAVTLPYEPPRHARKEGLTHVSMRVVVIIGA